MSKLIPVDLAQCQVNQYNPFTMGGNVHTRCSNVPAWVVTETVPAEDGLMGAQSVCQACRTYWEAKTGIGGVNPSWQWEAV